MGSSEAQRHFSEIFLTLEVSCMRRNPNILGLVGAAVSGVFDVTRDGYPGQDVRLAYGPMADGRFYGA